LAAPGLYPFWLIWLDWVAVPIRATTFPGGLAIAAAATGDADLDGFTFEHLPGMLVSVSDVSHQSGGAETVTATLAKVPVPDAAMLASMVRDQWAGRIARLWHGLHDGSGGALEIAGYYTGYMTQLNLSGDPVTGGRVTVEIENYLAALSQARGRTYQDQQRHDAGDKSAARIRASANGVKAAGIGGGIGGGSDRGGSQQQEVQLY